MCILLSLLITVAMQDASASDESCSSSDLDDDSEDDASDQTDEFEDDGFVVADDEEIEYHSDVGSDEVDLTAESTRKSPAPRPQRSRRAPKRKVSPFSAEKVRSAARRRDLGGDVAQSESSDASDGEVDLTVASPADAPKVRKKRRRIADDDDDSD